MTLGIALVQQLWQKNLANLSWVLLRHHNSGTIMSHIMSHNVCQK